MYEFVTGPLLWLSFAIFFVGCIIRIKGRAKVSEVPSDKTAGGGSAGTLSAVLYLVFRIGLVLTPVFLLAHNIILKERWGFNLWALSESSADILTGVVIVAAVFLLLRKIALSEVRFLTTLALAIAVAPFITGFITHHFASNYESWVIVHVICGEILLIAIPFINPSQFIRKPLNCAV